MGELNWSYVCVENIVGANGFKVFSFTRSFTSMQSFYIYHLLLLSQLSKIKRPMFMERLPSEPILLYISGYIYNIKYL